MFYSGLPGITYTESRATGKNPYIENESEVQRDIDNDPLPYMMLLSDASYPRTFHKEDEIKS